MPTFELGPLTAVILFTVTIIGGACLLVFMPICFIQWSWNSASVILSALPAIEIWQAGLLYVALVLLIYLSGLVKIEIELERFE